MSDKDEKRSRSRSPVWTSWSKSDSEKPNDDNKSTIEDSEELKFAKSELQNEKIDESESVKENSEQKNPNIHNDKLENDADNDEKNSKVDSPVWKSWTKSDSEKPNDDNEEVKTTGSELQNEVVIILEESESVNESTGQNKPNVQKGELRNDAKLENKNTTSKPKITSNAVQKHPAAKTSKNIEHSNLSITGLPIFWDRHKMKNFIAKYVPSFGKNINVFILQITRNDECIIQFAHPDIPLCAITHDKLQGVAFNGVTLKVKYVPEDELPSITHKVPKPKKFLEGYNKNTPPIRSPAKGPSAKDPPTKGTPAKETPAKGTPAKGTPAKETPAKGPLAKGPPAEESLAKGAHIKMENVIVEKKKPFVKLVPCPPDSAFSPDLYGLSQQFLKKLGVIPPLRNSIYISNLDSQVTEEKLSEIFSIAGQIKRVTLMPNMYKKDEQRAWIDFDHPVEAVQAISMFKTNMLYNRPMNIRMSTTQQPDPLPHGLMSIGPGLGENFEPLKGVRTTIEVRNLRQMLNEICTNKNEEQQDESFSNSNSGDACQNAPFNVQPNNFLMTLGVLQGLMQNGTDNNLLTLLAALQNPNMMQNIMGTQNSYVPENMRNMNEGSQFSPNKPQFTQNVTEFTPNMGPGPSNMPRGPSNIPHGAPNMPTIHGHTNMSHGAQNMPHGPSNMPHGPTNMSHGAQNMPHGPSNMQHGPSNMQQGPSNIPHSPSNMPHGVPNMPHGPSNILQGAPNMSHGHSNMPHGAPNMPHGPSNIPNSASNMPRGPSNMPHGAPNMPHGAPNMPRVPSNMPQGAPNMPQGAPNMPQGAPHMPQGAPNMPQGAPNMPQGAPNMPHGSSNMIHGAPNFNQNNMMYPHNFQSSSNQNRNMAQQNQQHNYQGTYHGNQNMNNKSNNHENQSSDTSKKNDLLFFKNLPDSVTAEALNSKLREVGDLVFGETTGFGRAIVRFKNTQDAERCIKLFHRSKVDGQVIQVSYF